MRVFKQEKQRPLPCVMLELIEQRGKGAATLLGGVRRQLRVTLAKGNGQQRGKKRRSLLGAGAGFGAVLFLSSSLAIFFLRLVFLPLDVGSMRASRDGRFLALAFVLRRGRLLISTP